MESARLKSNGLITFPTWVTDTLGLKEGDRINFVELENGTLVIEASTTPVQRLKGLIRRPASSISIESMNPTHVKTAP